MDSRFVRNIQKKQKKDDQLISGMAAAIFGLFVILVVLGVLWLDGRLPDLWIGLWVGVLTLTGTYILFALKVASQMKHKCLLVRQPYSCCS